MKMRFTNSLKHEDSRTPLLPGTVIKDTHDEIYTIQKLHSVGGSALIYQVECAGLLRKLILKECFPNSDTLVFFRRNGVVHAADADAQNELDRLKSNMERESQIGQMLSRDTGRIIGAWKTLNAAEIIIAGKSFDATESCFILMEQATGDNNQRGWFLIDLLEECSKPAHVRTPLRNGGQPSPYVTICVIEELLKALATVHKKNYIHGDINEGNIFFMGHDDARGDIGVGQLIDFGNTLELQSDGKTALIDDIYSTESYGAPEIFERTGAIKLTPSADVFSVGTLMVYMLKGMKYKKIYDRDVLSEFSVNLDTYLPIGSLIRCGYRRESAMVFRKILAKSLKHDPEDRYRDAGEMLEEIIVLKKMLAPPKFMLPPNLSPRSSYFVKGSRDAEIARLERDLKTGTNPLWIFGLGGIGKTELACAFARKEIEGGRAAFLVTFSGSIEETIMHLDFSGWHYESDGTPEDRRREYSKRLELLKENYNDALFIIDNFDSDEKTLAELQQEPAYQDLLGLGMKILFTTRSRPNASVAELKPLSENDCMTLFNSIMKFSPDKRTIVSKLIREVDCHTMMVEMMARTLNSAWCTLTPESLLERLRLGKLDTAELPKIMQRKNFSEREAKIYGHLRTLFRLVNSDEYRDVLCDLVLIPPNGFDAAELIISLEGEKKKWLKRLENGGWCRRHAEDNKIFVHSLIRLVIKTELRPTNADCEPFLSALWNRHDDEYPPNEDLFRQLAKLYMYAVINLGDPYGDNNFRASKCYFVTKNFECAFAYGNRSLEVREKIFPMFDHRLAATYLVTGLGKLFMHELFANPLTASKCILNAVIIYEQTAAEDEKLAEAYAALALGLDKLNKCEEAVRFAEKAVCLFENAPPKNKFKLAGVHGDLGRYCMKVNKFDESLTHLEKSAKIFEELTPQGHLNVALAYRAIAEFYQKTENLDQAFHYSEKALQMQESLPKKNMQEIGATYRLLGNLYSIKTHNTYDITKSSTMYELAFRMTNAAILPLQLRLLEFAKEIDDKDLKVHRYRGAADCCRITKQLDAAENYILAAIETILPKETNSDEVFLTYFTASQIYADKKKFEKALHYAHLSRKVYVAANPNDDQNFLYTQNLNIQNIHDAIKFENLRLLK